MFLVCPEAGNGHVIGISQSDVEGNLLGTSRQDLFLLDKNEKPPVGVFSPSHYFPAFE